MDDLLNEFVAETRETLEALAGEIVAWELDPTDRPRLDAIFRFFHTVKGSCGFLDLPRLAHLSHAAEDVLSAVRDGRRRADAVLVTAILAVIDRIGILVDAIESGGTVDGDDDALVAALEEAQVAVPVVVDVATARTANRTIRFGVDALDRLMGGMSDMVLARNELMRRLRESGTDPVVDASLERLSSTVDEMRDAVTRMRMQPIGALFAALPRIVRDAGAECEKAVTLEIAGADVELDREMIDVIRDPLLHIVRNAVDHGIETPAERRNAAKRESGRLLVKARQAGNQIIIEVTDDGRGINVAKLAGKAVAMGAISAADLAAMPETAKLDLVFLPGLSSRDIVGHVSGRGVGMDVVRNNIEQVGGRIVLSNRAGHGLTIAIHVPLTLSIIPTVGMLIGGQRFAVARSAIEEIVSVHADFVVREDLGGAAMVSIRGRRLPWIVASDLMRLPAGEAAILIVVTTREGDYALGIDAVLDGEELVVKPAAPGIMATGLFSGQTLPDSGMPVLLLDPSGVAARAGLRFHAPESAPLAAAPNVTEEPVVEALLILDLDGVHRLLPVDVLDRIQPMPAADLSLSAGRLRFVDEGVVVPVHAVAPIGPREDVAMLRLTDGSTELGYAAVEAQEIVTIPAKLTGAGGLPGIAGLAVLDGRPIEVIDGFALFAGQQGAARIDTPPVCQLRCDASGWMATFLRPMLETAGYRCITAPEANVAPVALIVLDEAPAAADPGGAAPLVRLRSGAAAQSAEDDSIYRYDRDQLIAAVRRHARENAA